MQNGNFECLHYLDYWTAQDVTNTYHMSADGDNSYNSYQFKIVGYPASETTVASLSQDVPGLTIGASYMLSYALWFNKCDPSFGFVGVNLNHHAVSTFDSCDDGQAAVGKWLTVTNGPFTAVANTENLKFEFVIGLQDLGGYIRLDNVAITPA